MSVSTMCAKKKEVNAEVTSGMSSVIGSMSTITELMGSVWDMMTSNPLLTLFLATGLLTVGIGAFVKIKRAAKR